MNIKTINSLVRMDSEERRKTVGIILKCSKEERNTLKKAAEILKKYSK